MKVNGNASLAAPPTVVFDALRDPKVLVATIPGCEKLEEIGADSYKMTVSAGVASIKGTYVGSVTLTDPAPPHAFTLRAQGQGAPGTVDATVRVRLSEAGGGTRVDYDADAVVGGMIGGVGQRMLATVGKRTAGEFFAAVDRVLAVDRDVAGGPKDQNDQAAPTSPSVHSRTVPGVSPKQGAPMVAAFGAGGIVALAGVLIGWLIGRDTNRRSRS